MRFFRILFSAQLLVALMVLVLLCMPEPGFALDAAQGKYEFTDAARQQVIPVWYYRPASFSAKTPVLFVLHDSDRDAQSLRDAWKEAADRYNFMVLAPEFSHSAFPAFGDYPLGGARGSSDGSKAQAAGAAAFQPRQSHAYRSIDALFTDFTAKREESAATRYYIFGQGAGALFVQRLVFFLPEARASYAVCVNAPYYTLPDPDLAPPLGVKGDGISAIGQQRILSLPLLVLLADAPPGEPASAPVSGPDAAAQGVAPLERGQNFFAAGKALASRLAAPFGWQLQLISGPSVNTPPMGIALINAAAKAFAGAEAAFPPRSGKK